MSAWAVADIPDLTGKVALVTGSTDGLGAEVARQLAAKGAHVIVAGRSAERGTAVARAIGGTFHRLDLGDLAQVRAFAAQVTAQHPVIDILVNNAGVALIPELTRTADGLEMQVGVNHLGHVALTAALLPALAASGDGRVVGVSSIAAGHVQLELDNLVAEKGYRFGQAYGRSKLAVLLFMRELDRRLNDAGLPVRAIAAHPGVAVSNLQNAGPSVGRTGKRAPLISVIGNFVTRLIGQGTAQGALPILRAATDPQARRGGYYGPDGLGQMRGNPVLVVSKPQGRNMDDAQALWDKSARLTATDWSAAGL